MQKTNILLHRQFFRLWLGQVTSQAGAKVYQIAIIWWIISQAAQDQAGLMLGAFMVAQALPSLLFFKLMGKTVDKMPSKLMLVMCDLSSASIMALVAWQLFDKSLSIPLLIIFGFLSAFIEGFFNPAIQKCLPDMVDEEYLEEAVAYQSSTQYLSSFGGSVLGAFLISWLGIEVLVAINSATYVISALIETTLDFSGQHHQSLTDTEAKGQADEQKANISDWRQIPLIKQLLYAFGFVNFFATPVLLILPLFVKQVIKGTPKMLGLLEACLWVGILIGTFSASKIKCENKTVKMTSVSVLVFGLCLFVPGFFASPYLYALALVLAGVSLGINNVKFTTLFQEAVPWSMKGAFFAAMQAIISFSYPVAYLVFGYLGDALGPMRVCIAQGLGMVLLAAVFAKISAKEHILNEYRQSIKSDE